MSGRRRWFDPLSGTGGGATERRGPRSDRPTRVDGVLARLVDRRDWTARLEGARVHDVWAEIAGDTVAEHVRPVRLLGGVLVLEADSGAWATQVRYLSTALVERANAVLGEGLVESVTVTASRGGGSGAGRPSGR